MKVLKRLLIGIICVAVILGVALIGGYVFVRIKYDVNLFDTVSELKTLSQEVDESELCPNVFDEEDFVSLKDSLNNDLVDGVVCVGDGGYNGYSIDMSATEKITDITLLKSVSVTEKQTGALGQIMFYEQTGGVISVGNKELATSIKQVDFSNIKEDGSADLNLVVKLDLTDLVGELSFPFSLFKKYIPESLYVSSTVGIEKTDDAMGYNVVHRGFKINNLNEEETADLFKTLELVLPLGSAEDLNLSIGRAVADVLIGDSENPGFAYSLNPLFNTFCFKADLESDCFVIERK